MTEDERTRPFAKQVRDVWAGDLLSRNEREMLEPDGATTAKRRMPPFRLHHDLRLDAERANTIEKRPLGSRQQKEVA